MNTKITKKFLYVVVATLGFTTVSLAQTTSTTSVNTTQAEADGAIVKVIDNKGTIKYLQSNNGITSITSTAANNKTTTTLQLGGTFIEDTKLDFGGKKFSFDNVIAASGAAATTLSATANVANPAGWSLLVRDEVTGEVKKLLATNLVQSGQNEVTAGADDADVVVPIVGVPTDKSKIFVFRNGAKLLNADFTVIADTSVTVTYNATTLPIYTGDVIEVQFIK